MTTLEQKSKPYSFGSLSLAAQHFDFQVSKSLVKCQSSVQRLTRLPSSWWYGSKPDVNFVPMGDDLVKFHILRRAGLNAEVEAMGTLQRISDSETGVIGFVRIPQSTIFTLLLYLLSLIGGIIVVFFVMPGWFRSSLSPMFIAIMVWSIILIFNFWRVIHARNELFQYMTETLELD